MIIQKRLLYLLCLFLLSGCVSIAGKDQTDTSISQIALRKGEIVGQTFVARNDGLNGIEIHLRPENGLDGTIWLHLRSDPGSNEDLAESQIAARSIATSGFHRFHFPAQSNSRQQYYYIFWEFDGDGTLWIDGAGGEAYLDGASHVNLQPIDQQIAFHLTYEPSYAIWGIIKELIKWAGILVAGITLYVLPGFGLLTLLWPSSAKFGLIAQSCIGIGLSLAIYPILFLWTDLLDLHLGSLYAWMPPVLAMVVLLWKARNMSTVVAMKGRFAAWRHSDALGPDLSFLVIGSIIFLGRFIAVRTLDVPMWGDSLQHTMIAQLMLDNHGLFSSWDPYAQMTTFTYHFGFHTHVAVFEWLTGKGAVRATLWTGQILNGLAVLALYPLAVKLGRNRWAGTASILIAGLLCPMPMYYVNWGRYTQLAGQAILPIAVFLSWHGLDQKKVNWAILVLASIAIGGLALTHYRILIFLILFYPAYFIFRTRNSKLRAPCLNLLVVGGISAGIFLPRFISLFSGSILNSTFTYLSTPANSTSQFIRQYNAIGDLEYFQPIYIWILLVISIGWLFWRKNREAVIIVFWWLIILLAANPNWLGLPGVGALSNFAVFIAIYIPTALLIGGLFGWLIPRARSSKASYLIWITLIAIAIMASSARIADSSPFLHALVTRPDIRASAWIDAHLPEEAHFLVNSFLAYGDSLIVGSDAGWWLPLLAKRATTVPPINYDTERGPDPDYRSRVNSLTQEILSKGVTHPEILELLRDREMTHIYIGQRNGQVNYHGPSLLPPEMLLSHESFKLVYHADRVWIFEIIP